MAVYSEELSTINVGNGLYTAELAASIPDGYVTEAFNLIATGESLESRQGFTQTTIDFKKNGNWFTFTGAFYELVQFNVDWPVLAIPDGTSIHFIRSSQLFNLFPTGDGYMLVNPAVGDVYSLCQYSDRTYFSTGLGVYVITAYDWNLDTITFAPIVGAPTALQNLFSFKDRIWGHKGDRLYYTDVASVTSPYPETWSLVTNFEPMRQDRGAGEIQQVVPLGNRLLVFTTAGLFTLLVEGSPSSWIKRTLDVKSSTTRSGCAFEAAGIVYFVDTRGVYATNGLSTAKISGTIDNYFYQPNSSLRHSIKYMEDGMLLTISKYVKVAGVLYLDSSATKVLYSRLDPIAWTEWNIDGTDDYPSAFGSYRIAEVIDVSSGVNTFLSLSPVTLLLLVVSNSTEASPATAALQLVVYDGHQNDLWRYDGGFERIADSVKLNVVTRFSDAGSVVKLKRAKEAYLEAFTSDDNHDLHTKFIVDGIAGYLDERAITAESLGDNVNLIRIPCKNQFRRIAGVISSQLQSALSQVKIRSIHLIMHTHRNETEDVR